MPTLPKKFCARAGCNAWAENGTAYCAAHRRTASAARMQSFGTLYNSAGWKHLRREQLRTHPLCEECKAHGRLTPATECDHIIPHRGNAALFYDKNNLQSLCKRCHSAKTAAEDGGFGNNRR